MQKEFISMKRQILVLKNLMNEIVQKDDLIDKKSVSGPSANLSITAFSGNLVPFYVVMFSNFTFVLINN